MGGVVGADVASGAGASVVGTLEEDEDEVADSLEGVVVDSGA